MRRTLLIIALITTLFFLGWHFYYSSKPLIPPPDDFVEYWSAGRLNLMGENPYSPEKLFQLQKQAGSIYVEPIMMWNPPWTLTLIMPFGLLDYPTGRVLWLLLHIAILFFCTKLIWPLYGGQEWKSWIALIILATFTPLIFALRMGQISPVILLGIVAFLHFQRSQKGWWAGSLVMLAAVKPHLLHLFWLALLFWSLDRRQWHILAAGALTIVTATIIPLIFNHHLINQYFLAASQHPPSQWASPTIGSLLRTFWGVERFWLQFVPMLLSFIWFIFYWRVHRKSWSWVGQTPLLLLVSIATTSYGWEFDQVVLLLPILSIFVSLISSDKRQHLTFIAIVISYIVINGLALMINLVHWSSFFYFWMAPAWLIWYLIARSYYSPGPTPAPQLRLNQ
jgi:hypothetical protein